jgi:hypothetical protein
MHPLRRVGALALLLALGPTACGEAPTAPVAVPKEFDDLDEEAPEPAATPAPTELATPEPTKPAAAQPPAIDPRTTNADAPGTIVAAADAPANPAAVAPTPAEPAAAAPTPGKTTGETRPTKKSGPRPAEPVPSDSPTPAPAPAPAPTPEPAPAAPIPEAAPIEKPAPPPVPAQQRFAGSYRFVGGEAQRSELTAAIETAVQELNALIRGIGRKRLTESNVIRDQITIAVDGDKVTTTFAPGRTVSGKLEGPSVPWTSDTGKPLTVKFSLVKGRLVQTFTADDGGRRSVFTLNETGDRLTLSVTITSERLTNPLKYALSYKRE